MKVKCIACICLVTYCASAWTNSLANETDGAQARAQLRQLQSEIGKLQKSLARTRKSHTAEQQALEAADREIQSSALQLREIESVAANHQQTLSRLGVQRDSYLDTLDARRDMLAQQIMAAYRLGRESRLKLVLNQDSPAQLSRLLAYYDYFSHAQARQISELKQVLRTLDEMQAGIDAQLTELRAAQRRRQAAMSGLQEQREKRRLIVATLAGQINADEARLADLQKSRRDLETLLEKLTDVLADIPADLGKRQRLAQLKGRLPVPLEGRVRHAFGQPRVAGLRWHGWLISAAIGSEVRSIAYGRVAFSDWLRGYGLLMIIDHGDGFMSLYANNESLLREVGDWVEPGTAICTVGDSPGSGTGLYFELRRNGKAVDPALWLNR